MEMYRVVPITKRGNTSLSVLVFCNLTWQFFSLTLSKNDFLYSLFWMWYVELVSDYITGTFQGYWFPRLWEIYREPDHEDFPNTKTELRQYRGILKWTYAQLSSRCIVLYIRKDIIECRLIKATKVVIIVNWLG